MADQTLLNDGRDFWWACVDICVIQDKNLSPVDKTVYAVLCTFASVNGRKCFPKVATIAENAGCSIRAVQESLKTLEAKGYLERNARYKEKQQLSSEYVIIGHKRGAPHAGVQEVHQGGAPNVVPELEPYELYTSLSEKEEKPSDEDLPSQENNEIAEQENTEFVDIDEVPQVMRPSVEYFLLKTGRKGITPGELFAVKTLEKIHVPARVNQEIGKAVARYEKKKRLLSTLTLEYIYESLKYQTSGKSKSKARKTQVKDPYEEQRAADLKEWEKQQQAALIEKYGGEP